MRKIFTLTGLTALLVIGALIAVPAFATSGVSGHNILRSMEQGVPAALPEITLDEAEATVLEEFPGAAIIRVRLHGKEGDFTWRLRLITADDMLVEARVDAQTGSLIKTEEKEAENLVKPAVSFDQAKATVLGEFSGATIIRADLHNLDEEPFWRFRLITTDAVLVEIRIDATSGEVLRTKELDRAETPTTEVSFDEAKATALAEFPGATINRVRLEEEDGVLVWRFRLTSTDGNESRVEVNAQSGEIVRIDVKSSGSGSGDKSGREGRHSSRGHN